ncbi:hypothetical protein COCNU_contig69329931G000010 [Cocos nucifera]|nr:hypothetical protein [Cocos nucifera]
MAIRVSKPSAAISQEKNGRETAAASGGMQSTSSSSDPTTSPRILWRNSNRRKLEGRLSDQLRFYRGSGIRRDPLSSTEEA